tara:strand:- start:1012 stop:1404 length:393 start_codon:yes stop_codon:yes gene_type:complete
MATTTAAITITSTDLTTDSLSLSTTATLTKAATANGLEQVIGVSRQTIATAGEITLLAASSYTTDKAHKLYVKNTSTTDAHNVIVKIGTQIIGRLYAGDWGFIPYNGEGDLKLTTSHNDMAFEYILFYEA